MGQGQFICYKLSYYYDDFSICSIFCRKMLGFHYVFKTYLDLILFGQ